MILEKKMSLISCFFLRTSVCPTLIEEFSLNDQVHVDVFEWLVWLLEWIERAFRTRPPTPLAPVVEAV